MDHMGYWLTVDGSTRNLLNVILLSCFVIVVLFLLYPFYVHFFQVYA